MHLTLMLLVVAAFICAILNATGRCPLWVSVLLVCITLLLQVLPR